MWKIFHKSGPKFEPWGHPLTLVSIRYKTSDPILTLFVLSEKYHLNRPIAASEKPFALSLASNRGGCSESKAFDKCSWSQSVYSVLDSVVDVVIVLGVDSQVNLVGVLSVRAFSRCG